MKRKGMGSTAALVAAALIWAAAPAPAARAEIGDSSAGAGVAIGLMVAVVVVYGLVALRSDVERYTDAGKEDAIVRAAKLAEESPLVLQTVGAPFGLGRGGGAGAEVAGATVGWRFAF